MEEAPASRWHLHSTQYTRRREHNNHISYFIPHLLISALSLFAISPFSRRSTRNPNKFAVFTPVHLCTR
ncbi:hypothetical protein L2E82_02019 [Cichorium intybus]|uniref:Uncharacterized protein n=1 Tax=Cichorium intybus TaxID=13427 RepID=A0ACB9H1K0_CICIN|nr:hypothetical protein L2E82_02019 [Cichorium intybus]